jgi:hypothetical protein
LTDLIDYLGVLFLIISGIVLLLWWYATWKEYEGEVNTLKISVRQVNQQFLEVKKGLDQVYEDLKDFLVYGRVRRKDRLLPDPNIIEVNYEVIED